MADWITWAPVASGYDWPLGTSVPCGDSAGYSATPTWAEIAAGTGLNQIVAAIRKFQSFQATPSAAYLSLANKPLPWAAITGMQTAINALRTAHGMATFTFTSYAAGRAWANTALAELRQALAFTQVLIAGTTRDGIHKIHTNLVNYLADNGTLYAGAAACGQVHQSGQYERYRVLIYKTLDADDFPIAITSAGLSIFINNFAYDRDFTVQLRRCAGVALPVDSDLSGDWPLLASGTMEDSAAYSAIKNTTWDAAISPAGLDGVMVWSCTSGLELASDAPTGFESCGIGSPRVLKICV